MVGAVEEPCADIRRPQHNERSSEGGVTPLTIRCDSHYLCPRPQRVPVEDAGPCCELRLLMVSCAVIAHRIRRAPDITSARLPFDSSSPYPGRCPDA